MRSLMMMFVLVFLFDQLGRRRGVWVCVTRIGCLVPMGMHVGVLVRVNEIAVTSTAATTAYLQVRWVEKTAADRSRFQRRTSARFIGPPLRSRGTESGVRAAVTPSSVGDDPDESNGRGRRPAPGMHRGRDGRWPA